jgi:hypothetical protein
MAQLGEDPLPLIVAQVGRCFDGVLPLNFAGQMLHEWVAPWWTTGNLARLRALLCDRAFEAGLEVQDLVEIGRGVPSLGAALQTNEPDILAHLRLLWSLRPTRPWDRFGKNASAYELAPEPASSRGLLAKYPDLLLTFEGWPAIHLCAGGLVFMDRLFPQLPLTIEVLSRHMFRDKGFELVLDNHVFKFPEEPEALARKLERLFRFWDQDIGPRIQGVMRWRSPVVSKSLRAQNAVGCPECHKPVLARRGEVGISLEVNAGAGRPLTLPVSSGSGS